MDIMKTFSGVNGDTFIGLSTKTKVALKGGKKNPMQGRITKVMSGANVMVFQNKFTNGYENMVKRRLEKEGKDVCSFEVGERTWGHRVPGTPVVEHNGKKYLEVIFLKPGKVQYMLDDQPIDKELIEGLDISAVKEESQGGVDNKVVLRTFAEESIVEVVIAGHRVS